MKKTKTRSTHSLKRKLLIGTLCLSFAISILFGVVSCVLLYQNTEKNMISTIDSNTAAYEKYVQKAIDYYKAEAEFIAQNKDITDPSLPLDQRKGIMAQLAKTYGFTEVMVSDGNGITSNDTNIMDREYFKNAIVGRTYMSSPLVRKTDGSIALNIGAKVNNGTNYNGIIIAILPADTFCKMIEDVSIGKSGYGFIVDKTGTVIAHKNLDLVTNFSNYVNMAQDDQSYADIASVVNNMIAGKQSTQKITLDGVRQTVGYMPIGDTDDWSLAISVNENEMMQEFSTSLIVMIVLTVIFVIISWLVAVRIANPIAKPIVSLVRRIETLADGDLSSAVPTVKSKDEIGILAASFTNTVNTLKAYVGEISFILESLAKGDCTVESRQDYKGDFTVIKTSLDKIIADLNRMFTEVNRSADQVATGASQVSSSAQALSQGATEQASSIEELSATITEIANAISSNASNAAKASKLSEEASAEVRVGNEHMQQMTAAMKEISDTSNEIGKIIKTIEDIAFQTNILALNAAVEAARAGSAGKGFAVVADEVRNLASKSAEAAKNTTALIENSIRAVNNGSKIAEDTAASLNSIIGETGKTMDLIGQIAQASNDQANSVNQVTVGMEQISAVVQTNSATSEETAATSEELTAQANTLKDTLSFFKLKN